MKSWCDAFVPCSLQLITFFSLHLLRDWPERNLISCSGMLSPILLALLLAIGGFAEKNVSVIIQPGAIRHVKPEFLSIALGASLIRRGWSHLNWRYRNLFEDSEDQMNLSSFSGKR